LDLRVVRRGPRPVPRPDPAAGLYETVLVEDGVARDLGAHLARLAASMRALYRSAPPDDLEERAAAAARGHVRARMRIDVVPGAEPEVLVAPLGPPAPAILRPVVLPGGLGPHKWRDRALLESHEADDPATLPLLLDADGFVLEASRATIVVRAADGSLHTPPADGRILPGVTARLAGARPRSLTLADLRTADAVFVASALRGLQPAALQ
jgi:para-aminobenzoate synthetase/4-amino-4-deoxychorismate lyase